MQVSPDAQTSDFRAGGPAGPVAMRPGSLAKALQRDLIPHLARAHRPALLHITQPEVDAFVADLLAGDDRAMLARLDSLRERDFSSEELCLDLLAPAARCLGELWNDDRCDFTSVTIGVGHLQRLMRLLGPHGAPAAGSPGTGLQLLLAQAPQEQHSFGLTMVAEFFRHAGWGVAGAGAGVAATAAERAQAQHFDVVGFSVGTEKQLDWLAAQIAALRRNSRNPNVVVMLGGPLFAVQAQRAPAFGADLCVPSARHAPALAWQCVKAVARR